MPESQRRPDRRVRRTREHVIGAFVKLVREQSYDSIRIGDVVREADVGRSTLYSHYRSKDDLLGQAFSMMYEKLAACLDLIMRDREDHGHLVALLEHF